MSWLAFLGACGSGGQPEPSGQAADHPLEPRLTLPQADELGACSKEYERTEAAGTVDRLPLHARILDDGLTWWRAGGVELRTNEPIATTQENRAFPLRLTGATPLDGAAEQRPPTSLDATIYGPSWPQVLLAQRLDYVLYVGRDADTSALRIVAAADSGGRVAFVGECEARFATTPFVKFAAAVQDGVVRVPGSETFSTAELLLRSIVSPGGSARSAFESWANPTAPNWTDRPADQRAINSDEMPPELRASLTRIAVVLELPTSWHQSNDFTLCTRTELAWGECTVLSATTTPGQLRLVAFVRPPGEGFELWALDGDASWEGPRTKLAFVEASIATAAASTNTSITMKTAAPTPQDAIQRGRAGDAVFEVLATG